MKVELKLKPPYAIFIFSGDLGFAELSSIRTKLNPILKESKYKIIVDLKNLESIDSSGVALLFHISQETSKYPEGSFSIIAPSEFVKEVMIISGIYDKFLIHQTLEEALKN